MIELVGNIWDEAKNADAVVITTNGTVKDNGACVMGRGIAKEARDRYIGLDKKLGKQILLYGNSVHNLGAFYLAPTAIYLISFPVKHNWFEVADLGLIERSTWELMDLVERMNLKVIIMPRPGCGNGKLSWARVKPILSPLLDDRFVVMSFRGED